MTFASRVMGILLFVVLAAVSCPYAFDLPDEAFRHLAGAAADPCSICAKQEMKKAFAILDKRFAPGAVIRTSGECRLVKAGNEAGNGFTLSCYPSERLIGSLGQDDQVPQLVLAFYTGQEKLVGISGKDFTAAEPAELFRAAKPGTVFEGELKLIPYAYGDGPAYNYFPQANKLQVHCIVVSLKAASGN